MKRTGILSALFAFAILALASCQQQAPMSAVEQEVMIDSIVEARTIALQQEMAEECEANFEAAVQARVDSLMEANK